MSDLEEVLAKLAVELDADYEPGLDDHGRFQLYRKAVCGRTGMSLLREALGLE